MSDTTNQRQRVISTFVAGLNHFESLIRTRSKEIRSFEKTLETTASHPDAGHALFAEWRTTVLKTGRDQGGALISLGHRKVRASAGEKGDSLRCAIGDHNGLIACLDDQGRLYTAEPRTYDPGFTELQCQSKDDSPLLGHIALAMTERVVVTFKQAPNGNLCHVAEFSIFDKFMKWFEDPSDEANYPEQHHMLPGRPKQLLANHATFILLMETGEVYTWGDARYRSLARAVAGDSAMPPQKPGIVEALGGLVITKVATGGWLSAAVSQDGAGYIWGRNSPGSEPAINDLQKLAIGEVALVDVPCNDPDPLDIVDVAVGANHIVVLAEGSRLFAVGHNNNGQFGMNSDQDFFEDWQEIKHPDVTHPNHVEGVDAGPRCTIVYVSSETSINS